MSSILTNNGAMVALQTLQSVNKNLGEVQGQISTGLKIGSAKDNAAVFSISQVMKSDVTGFKAISESLSLGASTVAVASSAASTLNETLDEIKTKVVAANEDNVDKATIQAEIGSLVEQLTSVVESAQFNGLNLLDGSAGTVSFLSSLSRDSSGDLSTGSISLDTTNTNLSTESGAAVAAFGGTTGVNTAGTADSNFGFTLASGGNDDIVFADPAAAGQTYEIEVGGESFSYVSKAGDVAANVAESFSTQIAASDLDVDLDHLTTAGSLNITNNDPAVTITVSGQSADAGTGSLGAVSGIDVVADAAGALDIVNQAIEDVIDVQASLGTTEKRIEIQGDFLSKLTDSFTSGIGSLVDADLEEASARLQALQVQQQLGTQALSIANQAPQQLLSLFR